MIRVKYILLNGDKSKKLSKFLICFISVFCFFTLLYNDNIIISSFGYGYIDHVFRGEWLTFFNNSDWSYGLTIYTIYAIWSIPVWIVFQITGMAPDMMMIPVLLWYKLLIALFGMISILLVNRIAKELCPDKKEDVLLQYVSSAFFIFPVFYICQCDIIGLCFVLAGLYYYIRNENKKFLLFFAIAVTMKYFAILVFIPLILYRFRKISRLLSVLLVGGALIAISLILIQQSSAGSLAMANEDYYVNQHIAGFSSVVITINESRQIGLFGFFYCVLCIIAFLIPNTDDKSSQKYAIWLALAGYSTFFLFYMTNIYWYVLVAPFAILTVYMNPGLCRISLLLELVYETFIIVCYAFCQPWVFMGEKAFSYLILKKFSGNMFENWLLSFLRQHFPMDFETFLPIFYGIAYACLIAFLILNFPGFKISVDQFDVIEEKKEIRIITFVKIGFLYFWIWLGIYYMMRSACGL